MFTAAQILDPETSQLIIDIEDNALKGGQDFLKSSVQLECFREDSALGAGRHNGAWRYCALLRCSGTCVRGAGGHVDQKR
jgi:hypothetical protein